MLEVLSLEKGSYITVMEMLGCKWEKDGISLTSMPLSCNLKTKVLTDVHMADMCGIKSVFMESVTSKHDWLKFNQLQSCHGNVPVSNWSLKHIENTSQHTWLPICSRGLLHSGPIGNLGQTKIKATRGFRQRDRLCAVAFYSETRRSSPVPPCWCTPAHAALWH